jgi:hypothetical protein
MSLRFLNLRPLLANDALELKDCQKKIPKPGCTGSVVANLVWTPMDVIKQQEQARVARVYRGKEAY